MKLLTSPDSHFAWNKICSSPTAIDRITFSGNTLKIIKYEPHPEIEYELKEYK
jgi:hypothetical protein